MNNMTNFFLIFTTFFLFSLPLSSSSSNSTIDLHWWCRHVPHPHACRYYLNPDIHPGRPPRHRTDFYKLSVRVALNLTVHAQSHLQTLSLRHRRHPRTRKAVLDCWKLYGNTLLQLNRTLHASPGHNCTPIDAQTWLSAALTNLRTCKKSFSDLKASYKIVEPIMRYNVSDLISNCLAINRPKNMSTVAQTVAHSSWTATEFNRRNLLQSNDKLVVAKDGSGRYRTVQAAVNAAAALRMRGWRNRIVIYVKAGVYDEIVTVVSSLTDLTLLGDGLRRTIITGSRSVARGYTTFSSPTFSKIQLYNSSIFLLKKHRIFEWSILI